MKGMVSKTDREIVDKLIANDEDTIKEFFFVRCRGALCYIGQYFCHGRQTPEELIGEFYEFLSADDWHRLRIFRFTCSLNSYITIIASRYFQNKRNEEMLPLDEDIVLAKGMRVEAFDRTHATFGQISRSTYLDRGGEARGYIGGGCGVGGE